MNPCVVCGKKPCIFADGKYFCMHHYHVYAMTIDYIPVFKFISYNDKEWIIDEYEKLIEDLQ